jgi:hypothetical protein
LSPSRQRTGSWSRASRGGRSAAGVVAPPLTQA